MNEETLFELALNTPPADRAALLDRECAGDPELRRRVEALLAADAESEPTTLPPSTQTAVTVIAGKYRLVELIGEGGMGTVYLAHQSQPMKRNVAIKLIKAGMDSQQVLARFDAERQALAVMDHPNIAKVLDGGLTHGEPGGVSPGRPYFVMELVKGVPITEYCDAHKLTPKERLELFVPVCQAIQHAHQKGIIHRDIKPSNVLIALYDDLPVPKVIDFGVAKATGATLTEETIVTGMGGPVGTPQYMSPEQASFNNLDIDTRSDVYCLGVLLYELLTGSPPFSKKDLEQKGLLEILRVIREDEPPKPSTKLSTANALPSLAAQRGTEPAKLTKLLRNELDWIVMKALEKDRARRYESANALARDVRRYLEDEPIEARPPSLRERVARWKRRHPRFMAAYTTGKWLGFVLLLMGIKLYGSNQLAAINQEASQRNGEQRDAYSSALHFISDTFVKNGLKEDPEHAQPFLTGALDRAVARVENQVKNAAAREIVYRALAVNYEQIKAEDKAELCWRKLIVISPRNSRDRMDLAECLQRQGKLPEAEKVLREALRNDPASFSGQNADHEVVGLSESELELTTQLAKVLAESNRHQDAADILRAALDKAVPDPSGNVSAGFTYSGIAPFFWKRQVTHYISTKTLAERWSYLANLYQFAGQPDEAAMCGQRAALLQQEVKPLPSISR